MPSFLIPLTGVSYLRSCSSCPSPRSSLVVIKELLRKHRNLKRYFPFLQSFPLTLACQEQVHFCREWDEKADLCKELGVTFAIEASVTGAGILESVVENVLLFGDGYEVSEAIKPREEGAQEKQSDAWWESLCSRLLPLESASETADVPEPSKEDA